MDADRHPRLDPLAFRSLSLDDVEAVVAVVAACERDDDGTVEIDASDVADHWRRPGFDLAVDTLGVFHGRDLVAVGEVFEGRSDTDVHPAWRGRGIGARLMRWTWERTRAAGRDEIGQTLPDVRTDAVALLRAHGYESRWTSWILSIDLGEPPAAPVLPDGFAIRSYRDADEPAVYRVIEDAFNEWPGREPSSFEAWRAIATARSAFAPAMSPLIVRGDAIAGVAIGLDYHGNDEGWIHQVAVAREHRRLGLGRALLHESFRRVYAAGRRRCGLSTDSRTGALALYEHAGMKVRRSYTRWTKRLP
ncbi:MAG TPA: GNAT family N-acetyltransferase [Actinomycetota bacterium]